jgi:hypothetical protein
MGIPKIVPEYGCGVSCLQVMGSDLGLKHSEIETKYTFKLHGENIS